MEKFLQPALQSATGSAIIHNVATSRPVIENNAIEVEIDLLVRLINESVTDPNNIIEAAQVAIWLKKYKITTIKITQSSIFITKNIFKMKMKQQTGLVGTVFVALNKKIQVTRISVVTRHERNGFKSLPTSAQLVVSIAASNFTESLLEGKLADAIGEGIAIAGKFKAGDIVTDLVGGKLKKQTIRNVASKLIVASTARSVAGAAVIAALAPAVGAVGVVLISVAIGVGVEWIDRKLEITNNIIKIANEIGDKLKRVYDYLMAEDGLELLKADFRQTSFYQELDKASNLTLESIILNGLGIPRYYQ